MAVRVKVPNLENREATLDRCTSKGAAKRNECEAREKERAHWVSVFAKAGDGRVNKKLSPEVRAAFKAASAMLAQNREEPVVF